MLETYKKIFDLLSLNGTKKLYWLLFSVVIMAVLDMVGVASIFPFLNVMSNPDVIQENSKIKWVYDQFHFTSRDTFLITLGVASFVLLIVNNILRASISVAVINFSYLKRNTISKLLIFKDSFSAWLFVFP